MGNPYGSSITIVSEGGGAMKCSRCNGFMVVEDCLDTKGEPGQLWIRALRCVMCGNLIDPIINRHRDGF